jgi:L,D-transpeptidase YcbB
MLYQRQLIGSQSAGLIGVILKRSIRKLYGNRVIYYTRALRSRFQRISMTLLFLFGSGFGSLAVGPATSAAYRSAPAGKQGLSSDAQTWLRTTIAQGMFSELRWPDFSDYRGYVDNLYELNSYSLTWVRGQEPTPQAQQTISVLLQSELKGLSPDDYDGPRWRDRLATLKPIAQHPNESDAVKFDLALTVCAMRYISDLHIGKVNPKRVAFFLDGESKKYDLAEFLRDHIINAPDVSTAAAEVEPRYPGYRRTIEALQRYIELAKEDDGEQLPAIKQAVVPGHVYAGIPRVARLLHLIGDLPPDTKISADNFIYDGVLINAVKNFQRRLGRDPSGLIDAQTVADLNVPLSRRVRQMQLVLERWRWLPSSFEQGPIIVNIPEFVLRTHDKDLDIQLTMKVVVGKALGHSTPVFSDTMEYVVFRPYWEVPPSITRGELIPHILRDPEYLAQKQFEVVDSNGTVVASSSVSNEVMDELRAGRLSIRQKPGPKNALGLVKFVFPNSYNVYMHDTPAPEFFAKSRRDFSHGCVRLEHPAELAAWVLRTNPGWNMERVRAAMNGETTQQVRLAHPIPVFIVYGTAIVTEDGLVHFYDDIYGHDTALEKELAKGYPYPW